MQFIISALIITLLSLSPTGAQNREDNFPNAHEILQKTLKSNLTAYQKYYHEQTDRDWHILTEANPFDRLSIFEGETHKLLAEHQEMGDRLISVQMITLSDYPHPLVLSVWNRGTHGQSIVLLDPESSSFTPLFRQTSSWPLSYKVYPDKLVLNILGDNNAQGQPKKIHITWKSPTNITPPHQSNNIKAFIQTLLNALKTHDVATLVSHSIKNIELDFGGGTGPALFEQKLALVEYRTELIRALSLGGSSQGRNHCTPAIWCNSPASDFRPGEAALLLHKNVACYEKPDETTQMAMRLSNAIVPLEKRNEPKGWAIYSQQGKRCFVKENKLYDLWGTRILLAFEDSKWWITAVLIGD